jgi:hypothetical protein
MYISLFKNTSTLQHVVVIQRHNFLLEFHEIISKISSTSIFTKYQQIKMPKVSHHFLQIVTTTH